MLSIFSEEASEIYPRCNPSSCCGVRGGRKLQVAKQKAGNYNPRLITVSIKNLMNRHNVLRRAIFANMNSEHCYNWRCIWLLLLVYSENTVVGAKDRGAVAESTNAAAVGETPQKEADGVPLSAGVWLDTPPCPWGQARSPSSPPPVSADCRPQPGWLWSIPLCREEPEISKKQQRANTWIHKRVTRANKHSLIWYWLPKKRIN